MTDVPLLRLRNLSRRFAADAPPAVDDLSLDIGAGEIVALIGPSGCGKTTTLRLIAGFETPDRGRIELLGRDVAPTPPEARGIGMVFQDYALFPHMTVAENILFGARDRSPATVARHLEMVGLSGFGTRYPDELSGGQQQRVALARSFAAGPGLILLDEPFSNLDAALRGATRREIRQLLKASGAAILLVTHDQEEALSFADRLVVMDRGRVMQQGPAREVYDRPANAFVAGFLGRTNLVAALVSGGVARTALGELPLAGRGEGQGAAVEGPVTLGLRPETIRIRRPAPGEVPTGRILAAEFKGHDMTYLVRCGEMELQVDSMAAERFDEGSEVCLSMTGAATIL
ncbi:ABC transporter ATP-binding protein [Pseudogemmobacter sonorensis]|uniref:ABC transporter ATP-binding protein n=1 Tax=Pseudogemmobacter sonorensis TaxID=2989681 RepID=UPI003683957F